MTHRDNSIVFFGTPDFARICLDLLLKENFQIRGVVTQPDKPAGRGHKLQSSPVKLLAALHNIPIFQPRSLRDLTLAGPLLSRTAPGITNEDPQRELLVTFLNSLSQPVTFIVVAYGKILPPALIRFAQRDTINVHASLLPRWRGAAPIQRALLAGDKVTGVCVMRIVEELDAGPVFARSSLPIGEDDNYATLHNRLAELGASLLVKSLPAIMEGSTIPTPQSEAGVTYAARLEKNDLQIPWRDSAEQIALRVRALNPTPGARTRFAGNTIRVLRAHALTERNFSQAEQGSIAFASNTRLIVATGDGFLELDELQFPGKKPLAVTEILKGRKFSPGEKFD